jgi:hypothetical protein
VHGAEALDGDGGTWKGLDPMTTITAKLVSAPKPLPILQRGKRKWFTNGDVVTLTEEQFRGSLIEAPKLFRFHCPRCHSWYPMLYQLGKKRLCLHCLEWRPLKKPLKQSRAMSANRG